MDYEQMLQQHVDSGADVTVGCLEVPRERRRISASCTSTSRTTSSSFVEKPKDPPPHARQRPDCRACSMGIYVFETKFLFDQLHRDAADAEFEPRFRQGHHSLPGQERQSGRAPFLALLRALDHEAQAYWRDVGTVDAYWAANIDLTDVVPDLDLFDRDWPIWTYGEITPPAKFVHDEDGRRGMAVSSLVSGGCIVSGASLQPLALFTGVRVHSYTTVENAVILPYVDIGRNAATLKNVVIDRGVKFPKGLSSARIRSSTPSDSGAPKAASALSPSR